MDIDSSDCFHQLVGFNPKSTAKPDASMGQLPTSPDVGRDNEPPQLDAKIHGCLVGEPSKLGSIEVEHQQTYIDQTTVYLLIDDNEPCQL